MLKALNEYNEYTVLQALKKVVSAKHSDMLDVNLKAVKIGYEY